jgi:hypothetical protein
MWSSRGEARLKAAGVSSVEALRRTLAMQGFCVLRGFFAKDTIMDARAAAAALADQAWLFHKMVAARS